MTRLGGKLGGKFGDALSIFTFLAEMNFDAWREDKGEHTGGIPQRMLRIPRRQAIKLRFIPFLETQPKTVVHKARRKIPLRGTGALGR
jgi:hypothetical protein